MVTSSALFSNLPRRPRGHVGRMPAGGSNRYICGVVASGSFAVRTSANALLNWGARPQSRPGGALAWTTTEERRRAIFKPELRRPRFLAVYRRQPWRHRGTEWNRRCAVTVRSRRSASGCCHLLGSSTGLVNFAAFLPAGGTRWQTARGRVGRRQSKMPGHSSPAYAVAARIRARMRSRQAA